MNIYSNNTWKTVVGMLKSNEKTGLSELECEERRKKYGDFSIIFFENLLTKGFSFVIIKAQRTKAY